MSNKELLLVYVYRKEALVRKNSVGQRNDEIESREAYLK